MRAHKWRKLEMCWFANSGASQVKSETGLIQGRQGETKKRGSHARLVGDRFNDLGNFLSNFLRLHLRAHKTNRSLHSSTRILNIYTEALTRFSHIYVPSGWSQQGLALSSPHPWKGLWLGNNEWDVHSKDMGEVRSLWLSQHSSWVNQKSHFLNDVLQQNYKN